MDFPARRFLRLGDWSCNDREVERGRDVGLAVRDGVVLG